MAIPAHVRSLPVLLLCLSGASACADKAEETGETGETGPGDTEDTYVSSGPVELRMALSDLSTSMPMRGPSVTLGDKTVTVGEAGVVLFEVEPDEPEVAVASTAGYWPLHATFTGPREAVQWSLAWPSEALMDSLATSFGISLDPTRGAAFLRVWQLGDSGDLYHLDGGRAVWPTTPTLSLAADLGSDTLWSEGDTTIDDSPAWLLFFGLATGETALDFQAPPGFTCNFALSTRADAPTLNIVAGAVVTADLYCQET